MMTRSKLLQLCNIRSEVIKTERGIFKTTYCRWRYNCQWQTANDQETFPPFLVLNIVTICMVSANE